MSLKADNAALKWTPALPLATDDADFDCVDWTFLRGRNYVSFND